MKVDRQLLAEFTQQGSQTAFAELVKRHLDLVYSCALRLVRTREAAEDVAQIVFANLARRARTLPAEVVLAGWLHRDTRFTALDLIRAERRRQNREQEAIAMNPTAVEAEPDWAQIRPWLDEALDEMSPLDRDALLLRFFEQRSLKEVGILLGSGEDAARKRVARALDKLREFLIRRGVTTSASALSLILSANGTQAAPAGLAAAIAMSALAGAGLTTAATGTIGLLKVTTIPQLKITILGMAALVALATAVLQYWATEKLRAQNRELLEQTQKMTRLQVENEGLSNRLAQTERPGLSAKETAELMRLRGEVGRLKNALASAHTTPGNQDANSKSGASADASQPYTTTLNASVGDGEILITGGWATSPGKRTFILLRPKINAPEAAIGQATAGPTPAEPAGTVLTIRTTTVEMPEASLRQCGLDQLRADGHNSSAQLVLSAAEARDLLKMLEAPSDEFYVTHGNVTLRDGMQSEISFGDNSATNGLPASPQYTIGFTPTVTADLKTVNLSLNAHVEEPAEKPSGK